MNYKKVSKLIIDKWFKNNKILYEHIDGASLICLDNVLIVRIPDVYNIFNVGMFEPANLTKIIYGVLNDCETAAFSGNMKVAADKRVLFQIITESGRALWIDGKLFKQLDIADPVFYVSTKAKFAPIVVGDASKNIMVYDAVICPVKI